jgi:ferritin
MITKRMQDEINKQIKLEMESAYLYAAMAAWFEDQNLNGFAHWLHVQFDEEMIHAMKFWKHIKDRGGRTVVPGLAEQRQNWGSALEVFKEVLQHEEGVTARINFLVDVATEEKDRAAASMLQWYIDEQVEEEANATDIIKMLERIGDHPQGLIMYDRELGARPLATPPVDWHPDPAKNAAAGAA